MNSVNFDPEKFDVDEYGNLYPKEGFAVHYGETGQEHGMKEYADYPGTECNGCRNFDYCWGENYESTKSDSES